MRHTISRRTLRAAIVGIGIAAFLFQCYDYINFTIDDAFISFRYAEQAFRGNGFVYNIGDYVEGYSNWSWVMILILVAKLGFNHAAGLLSMLWMAKALSFVFGSINIYLVHRLARRIIPSELLLVRYTPFLLFTTSGAFALWTMGAMEVTLCMMFYLLAGIQAVAIFQLDEANKYVPAWRYLTHGLFWLAACLTRPEPLLHAGVAFLFLFLYLNKQQRYRMLLQSLVPMVLLYGLFILWRYTVYQDFVPNTYYAKTAFYLGQLNGASKYLLGGIGLLCGPLLLPAVVPFFQKTWRKELVLSAWLWGVSLLFVLFVSGADWMPGYRFLLPTFGFLAVLAAFGMHEIINALDNQWQVRITTWTLVFLLGISVSARVFSDRAHLRGPYVPILTGYKAVTGHSLFEHLHMAEWLADRQKDKPFTVATGEAGIIGYRNMNMKIVDCLGLMDKYIARTRKFRQPFPIEYVLNQKPDYIILDKYEVAHPTIELEGFKAAFLSSPRFASEYQLVHTFISISIFQRR
jgi:arabinofuranosyltransferase